jgi:hypothetical protein
LQCKTFCTFDVFPKKTSFSFLETVLILNGGLKLEGKRKVHLQIWLALPQLPSQKWRMATKTTKRTPNAAFMKPVTPDEALAKVVGSKPLPRTEITKKLWDYIKANDLQDKKNRRQINADDVLKVVFNGEKSVSMLTLPKYVSSHLVK